MNEKCRKYLNNSRRIVENCFTSVFEEYRVLDVDTFCDKEVKTLFQSNIRLNKMIKEYSSHLFLSKCNDRAKRNGVELKSRVGDFLSFSLFFLEQGIGRVPALRSDRLCRFFCESENIVTEYVNSNKVKFSNPEELESLCREVLPRIRENSFAARINSSSRANLSPRSKMSPRTNSSSNLRNGFSLSL